MKYMLRFVPAVKMSANGYCCVVETGDDDYLCGEKERIAMRLEEEYGIPWVCLEVKIAE